MSDRQADLWGGLVPALVMTGIALAALFLFMPAAAAWWGDCPTGTGFGPCPVGPLPTPAPVTMPALNFDPENTTYLRYWFNYSTPEDFPWLSFAYSLQMPFILTLGAWFYAIIWFLYLGMVYMRAQDPILPAVIGILSALVIGTFLPKEAYIPAALIFVAALVSVLVRVLVERK